LQSRGGKRWPVLVASLATLAVFAIPHSLLGLEINWEALETAK
jgi:membrane protease YdiL (CAAX protease family)